MILSFPSLVALNRERGARLAILCKDQVGKVARDLQVVAVHFAVESARFCGLFAKELPWDMKAFIDDYDAIVLIGFSDEMSHHIRQHHRGQTYRITPRPPAGEEIHVADHLTRQMQANGLLRDSSACEIWVSGVGDRRSRIGAHGSSSWHQVAEKAPSLREQDLVLIHPGAGSRRKRWALDSFMTVAHAMREMGGAGVVFLIGPAESDLLPLVEKRAQGQFQIHQIKNLSEVMTFVKSARCFIGNDSGLAHLAAVMGVATVGIFGPSNPRRWAPRGRAVRVLRGAEDCAPCFETQDANCNSPQCLTGVSVDMVLGAAKALA